MDQSRLDQPGRQSRRKGMQFDYKKNIEMVKLSRDESNLKKAQQELDDSLVKQEYRVQSSMQPFRSAMSKQGSARGSRVSARQTPSRQPSPRRQGLAADTQLRKEPREPLLEQSQTKPNPPDMLLRTQLTSGSNKRQSQPQSLKVRLSYQIQVLIELGLAYLLLLPIVLVKVLGDLLSMEAVLYQQILFFVLGSLSLGGGLGNDALSFIFVVLATMIPLAAVKAGDIFLNLIALSVCGASAVILNVTQIRAMLPIVCLTGFLCYIYFALPALYAALSILSGGSYVFVALFPVLQYCVESVFDLFLNLHKQPSFIMSSLDLGLTGLSVGFTLANSITAPTFWYLIFFTAFFSFVSKLGVFRKSFLEFLPINCLPCPPASSQALRHKNGRSAEDIHFIIVLYAVLYLNLKLYPYESESSKPALYNVSWYQPMVVWLTHLLYSWLALRQQSRKRISRREMTFNDCEDQPSLPALSVLYKTMCRAFSIWLFYIGLLAPGYLIKYS